MINELGEHVPVMGPGMPDPEDNARRWPIVRYCRSCDIRTSEETCFSCGAPTTL